MPISLQTKVQAVQLLASCDNVQMNGAYLAEDISSLAKALPKKKDFQAAVENTYAALKLISSGAVDVAQLTYSLDGWSAYHYQHIREQGQHADMRIVFQIDNEQTKVLAFGHRTLPDSVYYTATGRL